MDSFKNTYNSVKKQLEKLKSIMKIPNNRPTQDIGGREIFESF